MINPNGKTLEEALTTVTLEDLEDIFNELAKTKGPISAVINVFVREDWSQEKKICACIMLTDAEVQMRITLKQMKNKYEADKQEREAA